MTHSAREVLDGSALRVLGYLLLAGVAAVWAVREMRHPERDRLEWWPRYWWIAVAILVTMAILRGGGITDAISDFGRTHARSGGWYDARRLFQALAVLLLTTAWFVGVVLAVWRVPPRRRRYLPHVIGLSAIVAFAAIRMISLHQVDTVLYRTEIAGVRIVAFVELGLELATLVAGGGVARFPVSSQRIAVTGGISGRGDG